MPHRVTGPWPSDTIRPMDAAWLDAIAEDPLGVLTALGVIWAIVGLRRHEKECQTAQRETDRKLTQLCDGQAQIKDDISKIERRLESGERRFDAIERGLPRRHRSR